MAPIHAVSNSELVLEGTFTSDTECENVKKFFVVTQCKYHMKIISGTNLAVPEIVSIWCGRSLKETIHFPSRHNSSLRATRHHVVKCSHMGVKLNAPITAGDEAFLLKLHVFCPHFVGVT